jgi:hypothetical protein
VNNLPTAIFNADIGESIGRDGLVAGAYEDKKRTIHDLFVQVDDALHSCSASPAVYRKVAEKFAVELKQHDIVVHEDEIHPYMRAALRYWGFYTD